MLWDLKVNIDKQTWKCIGHRIRKRCSSKKKSDVIYHGRRVDRNMVERWMRENPPPRSSSSKVAPPSPQPPVNSRIAVCSPSPLNLEFLWPDTLPWLKFQRSPELSKHDPISHIGHKKELRLTKLINIEMLSRTAPSWGTIDRAGLTSRLDIALQSVLLPGMGDVNLVDDGPSISRLASMIQISIPEQYEGEHLSSVETLLGPPGSKNFLQYLTLTVYHMSNNNISLSPETWKHVASVFLESGFLHQMQGFSVYSIQDTTVLAFMEKLFQVATLQAATKGDEKANTILGWVLASGYNPNTPVLFGDNHPVLMTAAQICTLRGRIDTLQILLNHGADPNLSLSKVGRPLDLVLLSKDVPSEDELPSSTALGLARLLISKGARVSCPVARGRRESVFTLVIAQGDLNVVKEVVAEIREVDLLRRIKRSIGILSEVTALTTTANYTFRREDEVQNTTALGLVKYIMERLESASSLQPATFADEWITADVFVAAADAGNFEVIQFLSKFSRRTVSANAFGITPLHAAAARGHIETCRVLLKLGHLINPQCNQPPPLHIACGRGQREVVDLLLRNGAAVDARAVFSMSHCRHWGIDLGHYEDDLLLEEVTPLQIALASRGVKWGCAISLIQHGAQLHDMDIWSLIEDHEDIKVIAMMLKAGADPNERDDFGKLFLIHILRPIFDEDGHMNCGNDYLEDVARLLFQHGAKIHRRDIDYSLLEDVLYSASLPILEHILHFADEPEERMRIQEAAILTGNLDIFQTVSQRYGIRYGPSCLCAVLAQFEHTTEFKWSDELAGVVQRFLFERQNWLETGARAEILEATAVGLAVHTHDLDILRMVCESLPRYNTCKMPLRKRDGWFTQLGRESGPFWRREEDIILGSPLNYALMSTHYCTIRYTLRDAFLYLLSCGYEPDWITWLALAKANETELALKLYHEGYRIRKDDDYASVIHQPLNWAISNENVDMVKLLLVAGLSARVSYTMDEKGDRTPLQSAIEHGNLDMIKILLAAGADVNEQPAPNAGATALQLASIKGYLGIAKLLLQKELEIDQVVIGVGQEVVEIGQKVIKIDVDTNAAGARFYGRTALEGAAEHGRIDMIELLLQSGTKTTGRGRRQYIRAIKFAERRGHLVAADLLKRHRAWTPKDKMMMRDPHIMDEEYRESSEESGAEEGGESDEEKDFKSNDEEMQQSGEEEIFKVEEAENRQDGQRQDENQIEVEIDLDNLDQPIPEENHRTQSFGLDGGLVQGVIQGSGQTEMGLEPDNILDQFDWGGGLVQGVIQSSDQTEIGLEPDNILDQFDWGGGLGQIETGFDLDNTLNQENWGDFRPGWMYNSDQNGTGLNLDDSLDPYGWRSSLGQDGMRSSEYIFTDQV